PLRLVLSGTQTGFRQRRDAIRAGATQLSEPERRAGRAAFLPFAHGARRLAAIADVSGAVGTLARDRRATSAQWPSGELVGTPARPAVGGSGCRGGASLCVMVWHGCN